MNGLRFQGGSVTRSTTVLVASDVRLYREGLAQILAGINGLHIDGSASDRAEILACLQERRSEVVLLDSAMPDSIATVTAILANAPETKVIALTIRDVEREVIEWAEAGVAGYVPREAAASDLIDSIKTVACGETLCSPRVAGMLLRRITTLAAEHRVTEQPCVTEQPRLTRREREIVGLIGQGLSNKQIARRLGIEVSTVKNHVHSILNKLKVHHRDDAAALIKG
jgi:two-component system nitrate/nitrite response regulator NarL